MRVVTASDPGVGQDARKHRRGVEEEAVEADRLPLPGAAEFVAGEMPGLDR